MVERDAAVFVVDRDEALVEAAFLDGDFGAALAFEAQRVDGFAADAFHRGDRVAADALVRLRMDLLQMRGCRSPCRAASCRPAMSSAASSAGSYIISVPPAMTTSSMPDMTCAAAKFTLVMPPPQKRSSVMPEARMS